MGIRNLIKSMWADERGQSTTEYILILSVVVMVALRFRKLFESKIGGMVETLGGELEKGMKGGE